MIDYKAVIFDLDGTILDSLKVWQRVDRIFFEKRNIPIPVNYERYINGMSILETAQYTKEVTGIDETIEDIISEWKKTAYNEYKNKVKLKSGVLEYLFFLKENNIKLGVATACDRELYEICLKNNKIYDFFDVIVDSEGACRGKEYPDIYELCASRLGVAPEDTIVFEDILNGIKGAKLAGMKVFAVYDKNSSEPFDELIAESDEYITDFRELLA